MAAWKPTDAAALPQGDQALAGCGRSKTRQVHPLGGQHYLHIGGLLAPKQDRTSTQAEDAQSPQTLGVDVVPRLKLFESRFAILGLTLPLAILLAATILSLYGQLQWHLVLPGLRLYLHLFCFGNIEWIQTRYALPPRVYLQHESGCLRVSFVEIAHQSHHDKITGRVVIVVKKYPIEWWSLETPSGQGLGLTFSIGPSIVVAPVAHVNPLQTSVHTSAKCLSRAGGTPLLSRESNHLTGGVK